MKLDFRKATSLNLLNTRTRKVIASRIYGASTASERARGLMFRSLKKGEAMVFKMPDKSRISLHMLFVFKPIDVIFGISSGKGIKIIEIKRRFRPFTLYTSGELADTFIELPVGACTSIIKGDLLALRSPKSI